ncbi:uncharacterized protein C8Q71DRAFT_908323 [Rhodofomes roseus]|uniref:F-box domain-containing protein n=1 Tax=Rhodofomes roseus TaxID=34475 RepID=A0ABQ8KC95_9APHY|nr:uncharacterized protein C8Q71DRAFT_908323 [Rhodofomes roseus]KAH9835115.1 hypothetical protein C8Q71DRAFT_908323 [Rhodofomes roseus]
MSTSLFSLNDDVLSIILAHLSTRDACQLTMTCRTGHALAMPQFLSEVKFLCISPRSAGRIRQFCAFMLADPERRIPCLRTLRLLGPAFALPESMGPDGSANLRYECPCHLSRVLQQASRLRALHLWNAAALLRASDGCCFPDALAGLPALDVVHTHGRPWACALLARTASRPRALHLHAERGLARPPTSDFAAGSHLPALLSAALEELRLQQCVALAENLYHASVIFPRLRTLTLSGYCAALASIASVFPALRTLRLQDVTFAAGQPIAAWPVLEGLQTNGDLAMPLVGRVRRLELQVSLNVHERMPLFVALLQRTTPAVLFCTVAHNRVAEWMKEVAGAAPGLRYLHLALQSLDARLVTSCAAALGDAPLKGVSFGYTARLPFERDERWAASLALKVAACVPSVQYVGFNVQGFSSVVYNDLDAVTWYNVDRAQRGAQVERLTDWRAEQVLGELLVASTD